MKIYVVHATSFDYVTELYQPLQNSELAKHYDFIFPHLHSKEGQYSKNLIKAADLILAEVSYPSTGSGIELGWADAYNVPILAVYREGKRSSSSISLVAETVISYTDSADLIMQLTKQLAKY